MRLCSSAEDRSPCGRILSANSINSSAWRINRSASRIKVCGVIFSMSTPRDKTLLVVDWSTGSTATRKALLQARAIPSGRLCIRRRIQVLVRAATVRSPNRGVTRTVAGTPGPNWAGAPQTMLAEVVCVWAIHFHSRTAAGRISSTYSQLTDVGRVMFTTCPWCVASLPDRVRNSAARSML